MRSLLIMGLATAALACQTVKPEVTPAPVMPRNAKPLLEAAAPWIAPDMDLVAVFDLRTFARDLWGGHLYGLLPPVEDPAKLQADLAAVYRRIVGIDLTRVDHLVLFVDFDRDLVGAVVMGTSEASPDTKALKIPGGLVVGNDAMIELLMSDPIRMAGDELAAHLTAFDRLGPILFAGSVVLTEERRRAMLGKNPLAGLNVEHLSFGIGLGAIVELKGDVLARNTVMSMAHQGLDSLRAMAKQLASGIDDARDLERGLAAVAAKHLAPVYLKIPQFADADGRVTLTVASPSVLDQRAVAAMTSATAIVAVPAFIKYQRRAQTTEAIDQLDTIYKSASMYYVDACEFPPSQPLTPDIRKKTCCGGGPNDKDGDNRCDVNIAQWSTPTWSALKFQMNSQHHFGYEFTSTGTHERARFTAAAYADLDCDGILSTFERYGYADQPTADGFCQMRGSSAFYKDRETE